MNERQCRGCGNFYPLTTNYFYQRKGGLFARKCIDCYLQKCKEYRDANKEARNAKARAYGKTAGAIARRQARYAVRREEINKWRRIRYKLYQSKMTTQRREWAKRKKLARFRQIIEG